MLRKSCGRRSFHWVRMDHELEGKGVQGLTHCQMPTGKASILSRLLPYLEEFKKAMRKLLGDWWDIAFADIVPHGPIVRQRCRTSS